MPTQALVLNEFKRMVYAGEINLATADIRAILLMSNTTALTQNAGITRLSHYTTLDEYNGASYARVALGSKAVSLNNTLNRAYFSSSTLQFGLAAAGSRDAVAVLFYKYVDGTAANDIPLFVTPLEVETPGDGTAFNVSCPAGGWLQHN